MEKLPIRQMLKTLFDILSEIRLAMERWRWFSRCASSAFFHSDDNDQIISRQDMRGEKFFSLIWIVGKKSFFSYLDFFGLVRAGGKWVREKSDEPAEGGTTEKISLIEFTITFA